MHKGSAAVADWSDIQKAWALDKDMTYCFAPKLTQRHVELNGLSAMNVKLAAQVFSYRDLVLYVWDWFAS